MTQIFSPSTGLLRQTALVLRCLLVCACRCHSRVFYVLRAGELSAAELENMMVIVANPRQFKIPDWFLNRQKDIKDGRFSQAVSNNLDTKMRDDLERLKKIRCEPYRHLYCHIHFLQCTFPCLIPTSLIRPSLPSSPPSVSLLTSLTSVHFWRCCFHSTHLPRSIPPPPPQHLLLRLLQEPPWSAALLGPASARAAHQDNGPQGPHCWCLQEALNAVGLSLYSSLLNCTTVLCAEMDLLPCNGNADG